MGEKGIEAVEEEYWVEEEGRKDVGSGEGGGEGREAERVEHRDSN